MYCELARAYVSSCSNASDYIDPAFAADQNDTSETFRRSDRTRQISAGRQGPWACRDELDRSTSTSRLIITTDACKQYYAKGRRVPDGLFNELKGKLRQLESIT